MAKEIRLEEIAKKNGGWIIANSRQGIEPPEFVRGPLRIEQKPLEGEDVFLMRLHKQAPSDARFYQRNGAYCYFRDTCQIKVTPVNYWR